MRPQARARQFCYDLGVFDFKRFYRVGRALGEAMKTVNIRQIKSNPGTALAAAGADGMVVVMKRDQPQALLIDLEQLGVPNLPAVRVALALSLFRSAAVSAGFAARTAGKPLADMRNARDWLVKTES